MLGLVQHPLSQGLHHQRLLHHLLVPHDDAVPGLQEAEGDVPHSHPPSGEAGQCDQETNADFDNCAVCIEGYRPNELVRVLPCRYNIRYECILYNIYYYICAIMSALEVTIERGGLSTALRVYDYI